MVVPRFLELFQELGVKEFPWVTQSLFWVSSVGPQNQFVHLWAYKDMTEFERRSRARDTHPDFPAYLAASEHLIVAQETRLIRAVEMLGWR